MKGRWVGELTCVADWPGFGKQGEVLHAHGEVIVTADGNALIDKFYAGNGSGISLIVFDPAPSRSKSRVSTPVAAYIKASTIGTTETGSTRLPEATRMERGTSVSARSRLPKTEIRKLGRGRSRLAERRWVNSTTYGDA